MSRSDMPEPLSCPGPKVARAAQRPMLRSVAGLGFLLLAACPPAQVTRTLAATRPPVVDATLGPGDLFDVRVFEEPDLTGTYRVGPEGTIDYPLVGRVQISGKLPSDIAEELRGKLQQFVRKPQVSVLVREMNSKRVIVYGQVQHPGTFPYSNPMTVSQAISLAGGFTAMAQRENVRISRVEADQEKVIEVNLRQIAEGRASNSFLSPGDEVYVPERLF
jgi:polysaccharide export outer membrane protein